MSGLSTHILDIQRGRPAAGVVIELAQIMPDGSTRALKTVRTNGDGRTDAPLLGADEITSGVFELRFHIGAYFRAHEPAGGDPPFLDIVPVRFGIADVAAHYHVPLLASPWAYSTYRGS